jgi:hypothetical protein
VLETHIECSGYDESSCLVVFVDLEGAVWPHLPSPGVYLLQRELVYTQLSSDKSHPGGKETRQIGLKYKRRKSPARDGLLFKHNRKSKNHISLVKTRNLDQ